MTSPAGAPARRNRITVAAVGVIMALLALVYVITAGSDPDPRPLGPAGAPVTTSKQLATATGRSSTDPETGLAWIELDQLPVEARRTLQLIDAGGPYPYAKDGAVFGNRERLLPSKPSGYYREYTVRTPTDDDRGARRIVTGNANRQFFYTDDHYASFFRIRR
jgi:ribonuclease T1